MSLPVTPPASHTRRERVIGDLVTHILDSENVGDQIAV